MSSPIKHIVEPALGWSFVLILVLALAAAVLVGTGPTEVEVTRRIPVEQQH